MKKNTLVRRPSLSAAEQQRAKHDLARLRAKIDRADRTIVAALMHRSRLVLEIATLKARANLGGVDVQRERAIFNHIESQRLSTEGKDTRGYSRTALRRIYRTLLDESRCLL